MRARNLINRGNLRRRKKIVLLKDIAGWFLYCLCGAVVDSSVTVTLSDQNNMLFSTPTFSPSLSTSRGPQGKAFAAFFPDINVCSLRLLVVVLQYKVDV